MVDLISRAHRILKPLRWYVDLSDHAWPARYPASPTFEEDEEAIGMYLNNAPLFEDAVLFTTSSIRVLRNDHWDGLPYLEINKVVSPGSKEGALEVELLCKDGNIFRIPIRGVKDEKFYDAFEVVRFIERARSEKQDGRTGRDS